MKEAFQWVFYIIVKFVTGISYWIRGFRCKRYQPKCKTYIVLYNHVTKWDHFLVAQILPFHMNFVASEHLFRKGFISKCFIFLVDPIARPKGASPFGTIKEMMRHLNQGKSVCISPEGNRSFSGHTNYISPAIAKLAKKSGAGLLNVRISGGYFVNPRWSQIKRKGRYWAEVTGDYTPEEMQNMSVEELMDHIKEDLDVDAYAVQDAHHYEYKCSAPAESLETALYACPSCHAIASLHSHKDTFTCSECGKVYHLNNYGYFDNPDSEFRTVTEWYEWQYSVLEEYIGKHGNDTPLFTDEDRRFSKVFQFDHTEYIDTGNVLVYKDRLEIHAEKQSYTFRFDEISDMAISLMNTLLFSVGSDYYELKATDKPGSAVLILAAYCIVTGYTFQV